MEKTIKILFPGVFSDYNKTVDIYGDYDKSERLILPG
jgi:hypothetical protein